VNLAIHFIRVRSSLILSCSSGLHSLYITLLIGVMGKEKGRIVSEGEEGEVEEIGQP